MQNSFGLNTNVFETNILNLTVVIGIVVTFVGDAFRAVLDKRRRTILSALEEAENTAKETQTRLAAAKEAVEIARRRAQNMRIQALKTIERENLIRAQRLEKDLQRLQEAGQQAIQLEYQRTVRVLKKTVAKMALAAAESTLLEILGSPDKNSKKHIELNEVYVRYNLGRIRNNQSSKKIISVERLLFILTNF